MSTETHQNTETSQRSDPFSDVNVSSTYGPSAQRRAMLAKTTAPYHVLANYGVEIPHRTFELTENGREIQTTAVIEDSNGEDVRVHLHQDVREDMDSGFGDFSGLDDNEDEDITWTVVGLADETVDLTVVGDWGKRRHVPFEEFADDYEPQYLTDGQPKWGY